LYGSSTWIGFDGQRNYRDSTLPQIGTSQYWDTAAGAPVYRSWYQWWAKGLNTMPQYLTLPVAAGDVMDARITKLSDTSVRFNFRNVTQNLTLGAFDVAAPPQRLVSGATAEWIMERPSPPGTDGWTTYPLPVYTTFNFTGCLAETVAPGGATGSIGLDRARLIRMYEIAPAPPSVRTISTARKLATPPAIELTYLGP
jgi:hypothetical protein